MAARLGGKWMKTPSISIWFVIILSYAIQAARDLDPQPGQSRKQTPSDLAAPSVRDLQLTEKYQTCATQEENGSPARSSLAPARRPRLGVRGGICPEELPLKCFSLLSSDGVKKTERTPKSPVARKSSEWSPTVNAGCGSPLLRGISAVNKSRLLSRRNT